MQFEQDLKVWLRLVAEVFDYESLSEHKIDFNSSSFELFIVISVVLLCSSSMETAKLEQILIFWVRH